MADITNDSVKKLQTHRMSRGATMLLQERSYDTMAKLADFNEKTILGHTIGDNKSKSLVSSRV